MCSWFDLNMVAERRSMVLSLSHPRFLRTLHAEPRAQRSHRREIPEDKVEYTFDEW